MLYNDCFNSHRDTLGRFVNKISSWIQYCASPRQMQYVEYKRGTVHRGYQSLEEKGCGVSEVEDWWGDYS